MELTTAQVFFYGFKYLLTAGVIVGVSEVAKWSDRLGGFIAALPIVTVITLLWLKFENQPTKIIHDHVLYTFFYVIPTLPMFLAFPWLFERYSFTTSLLLSCIITIISFAIFAAAVYPFGIILIGSLS